MKITKNKKQVLSSLLTAALILGISPTLKAGWVPDGDTGSLQICEVTIPADNIDDIRSLRRKVEQGFNKLANQGPKLCREKIQLKTNINLSRGIVIGNAEDGDGFTLEGVGSQREINAENVSGCVLTIKSSHVKISNIKILNAKADAICFEGSNANQATIENVVIDNAGAIGIDLETNNSTVKNVTVLNSNVGLKLKGKNNTITGNFFKDNDQSGLELVTANGSNNISKNHYVRNGADANNHLVSPNTAFVPNITSGSLVSGNNYNVQLNFADDVTKVELYFANAKLADDKSFIAETVVQDRVASFNFEASASDFVYAIAFKNNDTSDMSNIQSLSAYSNNGGGGINNQCNGQAIDADEVAVINNCVPHINDPSIKAYPQLQDSDCDQIYDYIEDADQSCSFNPEKGESDPRHSDSDFDGLFDGKEDISKDGKFTFTDTNSNNTFEPLLGETSNETKAFDTDTDGDTIQDGVEDKDKDGVKDSDESSPKLIDSDNDGIRDELEDRNLNGSFDVDANETKAFNPDTDQDSLSDGAEDKNHNGTVDPDESDPRKQDSDGDGNNDGSNDACPLDPSPTCKQPCIPGEDKRVKYPALDSDGDKLLDWEEDIDNNCKYTPNSYETDFLKSDTDGDGKGDVFDPCPWLNTGSGDAQIDCPISCRPKEFTPAKYDSDRDSLPNVQEDTNGDCIKNAGETDFNNIDTDGDGISDFNEVQGGLNPLNKHSDNDGVEDGAEDLNKDGVKDPNETDPKLTDSDSDGTNDNADLCPTNADLACKTQCIPNDPNRPETRDSDQDGLYDSKEDKNNNCVYDFGIETNYTDADTDKDLVPDGTEDANKNGDVDVAPKETDPRKVDSDGDGISDGIEDKNRNGVVDPGESDPTNKEDAGTSTTTCVPGIEPSNPLQDSDGDGLKDTIEDKNLNCIRDFGETDKNKVDSDGDLIPDGLEDKNHDGTISEGEIDPTNVDSDSDGIDDGIEDRNHNGFVNQNESSPASIDTDNDGINDFMEDKNRNGVQDANETAAYLKDSDFDSLEDGAEDKNKNGLCDAGETCADKSDTDGDGANDGQEISQNSNPLVARAEDLNKATGLGGCSLSVGHTSAAAATPWMLVVAGLAVVWVRRSRLNQA